jgi:hypothetical protein
MNVGPWEIITLLVFLIPVVAVVYVIVKYRHR